jgi:hypothetical protein
VSAYVCVRVYKCVCEHVCIVSVSLCMRVHVCVCTLCF